MKPVNCCMMFENRAAELLDTARYLDRHLQAGPEPEPSPIVNCPRKSRMLAYVHRERPETVVVRSGSRFLLKSAHETFGATACLERSFEWKQRYSNLPLYF